MKTEKLSKAKSPRTSAQAASKAPDENGQETAPAPQRSITVAAPEATAAPAAVKSTASRRKITTDLIAARAYILWEQQGRPHGHDVANWLLAESQLKEEQSFTA
jgi:hypothetical protein